MNNKYLNRLYWAVVVCLLAILMGKFFWFSMDGPLTPDVSSVAVRGVK